MSQDASPRMAAHGMPAVLPEFIDVYRDKSGRWHGDHTSGRHIDAATFERLEARAVATRVITEWRRAWPDLGQNDD